jgi:hypothetical protein
MNYSSRFFLYAPFALLLLIATGFGVHWWTVARAFERRLDALKTQAAMPGVAVRYASRTVGGFPFNLDVVFEDFRVSVETGHGPLTWRAEHFASHALTYGRDQTIYEAAGKQSLSWTDGEGRAHSVPFQTGSLHASAIRGGQGLIRFDLDLVGLGSPPFTADRLQLHIRRAASGDTLDLFAAGDAVHLSPAWRGGFGDTLKHVALQGSVTQAGRLDALRAGTADWRGAADAWRKAGGHIEVAPLELDWGVLAMMGGGALFLDDAHRPGGLIDFKIAGMAEWLKRGYPASPDGFAAALRARAANAGSNEAGKMGAVAGARDGALYLGDRAAGTVEPLY